MAIVNTYVVHNASKEQQLLFQEFRRDLAMGLLTCTFSRGCRPSGVPKKGKIASSVSPSVRLSNVEIRLPQFIHKKGRCEACSEKGVEDRPACICANCNVHLCCNASKNCFVKYHSRELLLEVKGNIVA